uniref:Uncharacterized protein n=1 Tax=Lactuca sativa TaxID=4236 RepID=A0A9R1W627_LACSA|nr:hypothetical protein LSAT_V11C200057810 [Lactuca sativa]
MILSKRMMPCNPNGPCQPGQVHTRNSYGLRHLILQDQQLIGCRSYQGSISVLHVANARTRDTTLGPVKGKVGISPRSNVSCIHGVFWDFGWL